MAKQHIDSLEVNLYRPMLDGVMQSQHMRAEMLAVARQILGKWSAAVAKDTGRLRASGQARTEKSKHYRDRRWEGVFEAGGPTAPYAPEIEDRDHALADVLRQMGYDVFDGAPDLPTASTEERGNQGSTTDAYNAMADLVDKVQRPGRRPGSRAAERDVAELRAAVASAGPSEAQFGRQALATYDALKRARQERDRQ